MKVHSDYNIMSQPNNFSEPNENHSITSNLWRNDNELQDNDEAVILLECAVCLQSCIHPAQLPCNHIFCFLCIKGVANQSKRCPMCRQEIPEDFLDKPQLVDLNDSRTIKIEQEKTFEEEYQWFYEGRNGWWQYDARTSLELETAYKEGKRSCELLIAGFLYIADFGTMFQTRRNDHSRKRRIKRDMCSAPIKGIAGLKLNNLPNHELDNFVQQPITRNVQAGEQNTQIPTSNTLQISSREMLSGNVRASPAGIPDSQRSDFQMGQFILRENLSADSSQELFADDNGAISDLILLP